MQLAKLGNKNAAKGFEWKHAVKHALKKYESSSVKRGQALRAIALKLVEDALAGKPEAWREISERLDGKVSTGDGQSTVKVVVLRQIPSDPIPIEAEVTRLEASDNR